jgi:hypothetical protein
MRTFAQLALFASTVVFMPGAARSEDGMGAVVLPAVDAQEVVPQEYLAPEQTSPEPPDQPVAPPAQGQATAASPDANGQWVHTQQYGWIWMPYGDAYTYAPPGGEGQPYEYVYYPADGGWTWVVAPWIWGFGPWPYFGVFGPAHFAWYGHGWWRTPSRWHFHPAPHRGGFAARGMRPAPSRGALGVRALPHRGAGGMHTAPAGHFTSRAFLGRAGGGSRVGGGAHSSGGHSGGHGGHR